MEATKEVTSRKKVFVVPEIKTSCIKNSYHCTFLPFITAQNHVITAKSGYHCTLKLGMV